MGGAAAHEVIGRAILACERGGELCVRLLVRALAAEDLAAQPVRRRPLGLEAEDVLKLDEGLVRVRGEG